MAHVQTHLLTHKCAFTNTRKRPQCEAEYKYRRTCTQANTYTYTATATLLCQAPQKWERSSDERLEDNWWYFCAGTSSKIKQISHLLCRWTWTVDLRFGNRNLKVMGREATLTTLQAGATLWATREWQSDYRAKVLELWVRFLTWIMKYNFKEKTTN